MSGNLHRIAYYSRNRIAGDLVPEIDAILAASRRNNSAAGVTGALMFNAGCFAQILEGPLRAVEDVFERIQQDERHDRVAVIACEPLPARRFAGWAMAFVGEAAANAARFRSIAADGGFDFANLSGDEMAEALVRLVLEDERA